MATYNTPGVYVEEISKFPPSVAQVETAIPAFIGYTEKDTRSTGETLLMQPTRIKSLLDYETLYGGADPEKGIEVNITFSNGVRTYNCSIPDGAGKEGPNVHNMYYNLQMYFANGGGPCYIVSVGTYQYAEDQGGTVDKEQLKAGLAAVAKEDEPTILVIPEAVNLATEPDFNEVIQAMLGQCESLGDRFAVLDLWDDASTILGDVSGDLEAFRTGVGSGGKLKYGAAYFPNLNTSLNYDYDASAVALTYSTEASDDSLTSDTGAAAIDGSAMEEIEDDHNHVYNEIKAAIDAQLRVEVAPSSTIAGIYAYVDGTRGVWKAPANVSLNNVIKPKHKIDNLDQDLMNVDTSGKSINAIRSFVGKGVLVWGGRTLAGNDNEWRYVSVRRFFNMVEESVQESTEWAVFEPNDANTWIKVKGMIENFLTNLWKQGALAGSKPEQAFYVNVGLGKTMTAQDILEGYMNVEIGMAAVRPAEFIVLKFSHKLQEA